jgi:A/G-specific adenine glycosylase
LLALPGLGPYTARAVRVFAHEFDDGVVDTNTGRVLARIAGSRLGRGAVQSLADSLVPPGAGWAWNQALMELGALVCRPAPVCGSCPIAGSCAWFVAGRPDPDPANGSAGVSVAQARFEGSDRQGRGRLVDALRTGPVRIAETASIMGWPDDLARAARVARTLVDDGLAVCDGESLRLP